MIDLRALAILVLLAAHGCSNKAPSRAPTKSSPATVTKITEQNLNDITLTPKARERLGIRTEATRMETSAHTRTMGGEVVLPPNADLAVAAPFAGTISVTGTTPQPGTQLTRGQTIFRLTPLPDPVTVMTMAKSLADARGATAAAKTRKKAAGIAHQRAVDMLTDGAGSQLAVDVAVAELDASNTALQVANETLQAIETGMADIDAGTRKPIEIRSPIAGILTNLQATDGQPVAAGAALFRVTNTKRIWIRVPIYLGALEDLDASLPVAIGSLSTEATPTTRLATPITAPPSANANAATVDWYYAMDNSDPALRPGTRVGVTLTQKTSKENLTAPWNAVVHDINGGTWVYVETEPMTYRRSRIEVERVDRDRAVLKRGPKAGTLVVTDGAAELFGTEFGVGK